MLEISLGIIAFILFAVYDLEQACFFTKKFHKFVQYFFVIGFILLVIATVMAVRQSGFAKLLVSTSACCFFVIAFFFLALLIYTLFFALPFKETYVNQNGYRTYTQGIYALCRHPGVLWFGGFYFSLWFALGGKLLFQIAALYTFLNVGYVILQDSFTFPRIFFDYNEYKQRVPFLVPTSESVRYCIKTLR